MIRLAKVVTSSARPDNSRQQLLLEQRRLAKLWDAFKRQEDEYRALERERDDLWRRVQDLEKATAAIGDPTQTATRLAHLETENGRLRADVSDLGGRLEENRASFHQEQERLAKLFKLYEDAEAKAEAAAKSSEKWSKFYSTHGKNLPPKIAKAAKAAAK